MSALVVPLETTISLGAVAAEEGLSGPLVIRVLRRAIGKGMGEALVVWIREEEQRLEGERRRRR